MKLRTPPRLDRPSLAGGGERVSLRIAGLLGLVGAFAPAAMAAQTLNSTGGTSAADGLRIVTGENTQLQVYRLGSGQVYSPSAAPPSSSNFNTVALAVGSSMYAASCGTCTAVGGTTWTNISQSAVSGSGTSADPYTVRTVVAAGTTGITLTQDIEYVYPEDYFFLTLEVDVPATNTAIIKLAHLVDTYLLGGDAGPAYVDSSTDPRVVGVFKSSTYEAFVSLGDNWDHYYSAHYNTQFSQIAAGGNLLDTLDYTTTTDNGIGVQWELGALTGPASIRYAIAFTDGAFATVDSDGDTVIDLLEGTTADTDGDGILDYLDSDDDGDGVDTADEDYDGSGTVQDDDADGDTVPDYLDADADGDGVEDGDEIDDGTDPTVPDMDGDGYDTATDCDDTDAEVNPGAVETCNGADDDCDEAVDEAAVDASTWYADTDGDDFGDAASAVLACDVPFGYSGDALDCDDTEALVNPDALEICNGVDDDCDGTVDLGADDPSTWYTDADGDAYGDLTSGVDACDAPFGTVADATDCDDTRAAIHPDATEVCDTANTDEDCDGTADNADSSAAASTQTTYFVDADGDNYGSSASAAYCDLPSGFATNAADCDDGDAAINPAASELAGDAVDEDCDGTESCYVDADYDGARTGFVVASPDVSCSAPGEALASADLDCDDANPAAYPGAAELTGSGVDENCDGEELCYADADDDEYRPDTSSTVASSDGDCDDGGEALASTLTGDCDDSSAAYNPAAAESDCTDPNDYNCDGTVGYVNADGDAFAACADCDDSDASVYPGAIEIPGDEIDGDCDGTEVCYKDGDADGVRPNETSTVGSPNLSCADRGEAPAGTPSDDCEDADASAYPGADEFVGDGIDSDCDGGELCYADEDGDTYRGADDASLDSTDADCDDSGEAHATTLAGDCDDADAAYNPAAVEEDCTDPNDYNCDGSVGYLDADADGFAACAECNDSDGAVFPDAVEFAGDTVDQNCDGTEVCFVDADDDGYRPDATSLLSSGNIACDGSGEALATDPVDDCDDADPAVNPGASDVAGDGIDQDCDDVEYCYVDADGDGYTVEGGAVVESEDLACDGEGEASLDAGSGDCDDADAAFNPGALEEDCTDPVDYNCDGSSGYADADLDGFAACEECDDAVGAINPDADEICNDLDDDCDGTVDVGAIDAPTWYADADGDGYTDPDATVTSCDEPEGYAAEAEADCDDGDATSSPGADEVPDDGIDQDCDGEDAVSGDTGLPDDTGVGKDGKDTAECGCASPTGAGTAASLVLLGLALTARRRRAQ
ncbi:MAG: MopE-related protein [Pseudomonadota bacterium]|nr:MopE-related protein [Pseudomonadota bacterium]